MVRLLNSTKTCWDIIKLYKLEFFSVFQASSLDLGRMNYEIITLIPKKSVDII
jgi:hypothetical protein